MRVLLLSTYDLGRQPFGLASPAAWLKRAGVETVTRDLSRDALDETQVREASLIAFYLPMHTATRLAIPVIDRVRAINRTALIAAYGLYAPLSEQLLRDHGVSEVLGPEAESALTELAHAVNGAGSGRTPVTAANSRAEIARLQFIRPDRSALPALTRYASVMMPDGTTRLAGATDASRGCKHRCRHCPIVPVYDGQFRVVSVDVVMADIDQQARDGAQHITFGDPDFLNGPRHAQRIIETLHARYPLLTYDVTIKVEHLLRHREMLPVLAATGCLFITTAVESLDDQVLARLEKGHTRADFITAVRLAEQAGVHLAPTFVAFTPWTTLEGYRDLLLTVDRLGLVSHVAPVQWGLRLLITEGSRLLELHEIRERLEPFDTRSLTYPWRHVDPRVDALQHAIMRKVGMEATRPRAELFEQVCELAVLATGRQAPPVARASIPYLNEPWYC
jgi:radical SAM superfamily enzyme YgiQ (UPF0313 family)